MVVLLRITGQQKEILKMGSTYRTFVGVNRRFSIGWIREFCLNTDILKKRGEFPELQKIKYRVGEGKYELHNSLLQIKKNPSVDTMGGILIWYDGINTCREALLSNIYSILGELAYVQSNFGNPVVYIEITPENVEEESQNIRREFSKRFLNSGTKFALSVFDKELILSYQSTYRNIVDLYFISMILYLLRRIDLLKEIMEDTNSEYLDMLGSPSHFLCHYLTKKFANWKDKNDSSNSFFIMSIFCFHYANNLRFQKEFSNGPVNAVREGTSTLTLIRYIEEILIGKNIIPNIMYCGDIFKSAFDKLYSLLRKETK